MKNTFFVLLFAIIVGCSTTNKEAESATNPMNDTIAAVHCACFDGIGSDKNSQPVYSFTFSNNNAVSVCGYFHDSIISEFDIFNCKTGQVLVEYSAMDECRITFINDKLTISELAYVADDDTWKRKYLEVGAKIIAVDGQKLSVTEVKSFKVKSNISENAKEEFLSGYKKGELKKMDKGEVIYRLQAIALTGNKEAYNILLDMYNKNRSAAVEDVEIGELLGEALSSLGNPN